MRFLASTMFLQILLLSCQRQVIGLEKSQISSTASSTTTSPIQTGTWKVNHDEQFGVSFLIPSDYLVSHYGAILETKDGNSVAIEGIKASDYNSQFDGGRISLSRTKDERILDILQNHNPLGEERIVNGIHFKKYQFLSYENDYGYVTKKGNEYYILETIWGLNDPVLEKVLFTLKFD